MVDSPISGQKDPTSVEGGYKYVPPGSAEEASQVGYQKIGEPVKDRIEISEKEFPSSPPSECDKPSPRAPDKAKTSEASQKEAIKIIRTNQWLVLGYIAKLAKVIYETLDIQKYIRLTQAEREIVVGQKIYELARNNAELAKQITDTQAYEKLVTAVAALVTATISFASALDMATASKSKAIKEHEQELAGAQKDLTAAKIKENPATKAIDLKPDAKPQEKEAHFKKLNDIIEQDKIFDYKSPEVKKQQERVNYLEGQRERNISDKERALTTIAQMKTEGYKAIVQAASNFAIASITFERGTLEEMKGFNDGAIQAFNKQMETEKASKEAAKSDFDLFYNYLIRASQADVDSHKMGRG